MAQFTKNFAMVKSFQGNPHQFLRHFYLILLVLIFHSLMHSTHHLVHHKHKARPLNTQLYFTMHSSTTIYVNLPGEGDSDGDDGDVSEQEGSKEHFEHSFDYGSQENFPQKLFYLDSLEDIPMDECISFSEFNFNSSIFFSNFYCIVHEEI